MGHLEGNFTPVLYMPARFLKVKSIDLDDRDSKFLIKATMRCQTQKTTKYQQL